jgi:hypothetical protein
MQKKIHVPSAGGSGKSLDVSYMYERDGRSTSGVTRHSTVYADM